MIQKPNLLPPAYQPPPPVNWSKMGIIALVLTVFFAVGIVGGKFYMEMKKLEEEVQTLSHSLSNLSSTQEKIKEILKMQKEVERLTALSGTTAKKEIPWSAILSDVARIMPDKLKFNQIEAQAASVKIQGTAYNSLDVAMYAGELRKFKWFTEVEIKNISQQKGTDGQYIFEVIASLPKEGGQDSVQGSVQQKPSA